MNCKQAKKIDLLEFLKKEGHITKTINDKDAWFLSPFRSEKKASFKISLQKNVWFDHGWGLGGDIIDFVKYFYGLSIEEALRYLSSSDQSFSFHQQPIFEHEHEIKINITSVKNIQHYGLVDYLNQRKIPLQIAKKICKEVHYSNNKKSYFSIGVQNLSGGWDLRNRHFKNASSPKDISMFSSSKPTLIITEGMFDMLSLLTYDPDLLLKADLMILNSTGLAKKAMAHLDDYRKIGLCLDNDKTGMRTTEYFLEASVKCIDRSDLYKNFKDPNEWLMSKKV